MIYCFKNYYIMLYSVRTKFIIIIIKVIKIININFIIIINNYNINIFRYNVIVFITNKYKSYCFYN